MSPGSRRLFAVFLAVLGCMAAVPSTGCLDSPEPLATIPKIVIYHPEDETKVLISSQDGEAIYNNINITLENESSVKTMSYYLEVATQRTSFELDITVDYKERTYHFQSHISVSQDPDDEENWLVEITDHLNEDKVIEKELPYKQLLESVE